MPNIFCTTSDSAKNLLGYVCVDMCLGYVSVLMLTFLSTALYSYGCDNNFVMACAQGGILCRHLNSKNWNSIRYL